ncbi:MFS transporter [Streptomyces sp. 8L]|uniref:MFS transporter n=1 Tax=Streptomyces sp. 8L TaxID=2877242 RepID=UPI001CD38FAE|nr:MFS transporter [Streptomyces sp. 8L]MCA1221372.1 MFS transporter [Streptomyces sp. 8L]
MRPGHVGHASHRRGAAAGRTDRYRAQARHAPPPTSCPSEAVIPSHLSTPPARRGLPLAGSYPGAVVLALLALSPFLVLTTALSLFQPLLMRELDASRFQLNLTAGMANAGYAFGAVASADLIQRLARRSVYLVCECGFVVSSVIALSAQGIGQFMAGVILQGLFTGMLLVAALPPLVLTHGLDRLPTTAAVISLGLFGMVTTGPVVGGLVGSYGGWRLLYTSVAVLAAVGLTVGAMTFEGNQPPDRRARFDWLAIPLALGTTVLPFFGVSWLSRGSFTDAGFIVPVVVGLLLGVLLVWGQYRRAVPLMPVRPISNTLPVTGTLNAMVVGASFTTLLELIEVYLQEVVHYSPVRTGLLIAPQLLGIIISAVLFRRIVTTRGTPFLALSGLVSVVVGAGILLGLSPSNASPVVAVAALFLGYGAGAGVAPGLFLAGFSVSALQLGPTFALVELLRSEAAFLIGPVLLHLAMTRDTLGHGFHLSVLVILILTVVVGAFLIGLYLLGGARPTAPDLEGWFSGTSTGYHSPALLSRLRKTTA